MSTKKQIPQQPPQPPYIPMSAALIAVANAEHFAARERKVYDPEAYKRFQMEEYRLTKKAAMQFWKDSLQKVLLQELSPFEEVSASEIDNILATQAAFKTRCTNNNMCHDCIENGPYAKVCYSCRMH